LRKIKGKTETSNQTIKEKFLEYIFVKVNNKTDGQKAFKLMNKPNNRYSQKQSQPFKMQDKKIIDD